MDTLLNNFSLFGLAVLAVAIVVLVAITRRVLETFIPSLVKKEAVYTAVKTVSYKHQWARVYNELGLYLLPYVWACLLAIPSVDFIYQGVGPTYTGRALFACFVATFSGLAYKSVKKLIPTLFGVQVEVSDDVLEIPPKE